MRLSMRWGKPKLNHYIVERHKGKALEVDAERFEFEYEYGLKYNFYIGRNKVHTINDVKSIVNVSVNE